jgi:acyl-CoA thioester hydrolase
VNDAFSFTTCYTVRVGDLNYGGHMGFDSMLSVFHDARVRYLKRLGYSEFDIGGGKGLIMTEAHVRMKDELFPGDELVVELRVSDMGKVRFTVLFHVSRSSDGKHVAEGETRMAAYDYLRHAAVKLPPDFIGKVTPHGTPAFDDSRETDH